VTSVQGQGVKSELKGMTKGRGHLCNMFLQLSHHLGITPLACNIRLIICYDTDSIFPPKLIQQTNDEI